VQPQKIMSSPYRRSTVSLTPEALADARRRYEDTDETQTSIAARLDIDRSTLARLARNSGWLLRKNRPPRDLPQADKIDMAATEALVEAASADAPKADGDGADANAAAAPAASSVADRLEAAVEEELRKVENLRSEIGDPPHRSIEAERTARTLATLTETLFKVRRLRNPGNSTAPDDDDLPADADGFRLTLAYRIEAFVRSRADGSVSGAGAAADAGAAEP
jgi:hypothetical protein